MKKTFLLFFFCLAYINLFSQGIGQWTTHFSYEGQVKTIVQGEEEIYVLVQENLPNRSPIGKLFSYDHKYDSFEVYSKVNGEDIENIAYSSKYNCLIIVRTNGDIDLQYSKDRYTNIPGLKSITQNLDKTVNEIYINGDYAYLSTNFGLLVINLLNEEIKETVIARYPFYSSCIYNGLLYSVTSEGILRINPDTNIQYLDSWENFSFSDNYNESDNYVFNDTEISQLTSFDDKIGFLIPDKALYFFDGDRVEKILAGENPEYIINTGNRLLAFRSDRFWILNSWNDYVFINIRENDLKYVYPVEGKSNEYWVAFEKGGIYGIKINTPDNTFEYIEDYYAKRPNGPASNYSYFLSYENNKLFFTGGATSTNSLRFPAALSEYANKNWYNYDKKAIDELKGDDVKDLLDVVSDPEDPDHIFVSSWTYGIFEFKNRKLIKNFDENNSVLDTFSIYFNAIVKGMTYDKQGNLFALNTRAPIPLKVMRKGENDFRNLSYTLLNQENYDYIRFRKIMNDRFGNNWVITTGRDRFLFIFNTNNTIENTADDNTKMVKTFYDQNGETSGLTNMYDIVEDLSGNIWLGTDIGIYVIYNTSDIFNRDLVLNKIMVPRNDGTNYADVLLEGVQVNTIAVDGGNRKWIGTTAGLYVVNGNGQETAHHFTMENSLLPSNIILSLAIEPQSGIVYIGTEKGLVSYKGEATEGSSNYSGVYVYPNPVRPEYDGLITIAGLKANSTVKITDVKGNLITQGKSLGGQYIWDGRNIKKERVSTGVYLVFGSSEDGSEGVVSKIMIVSD